MDAGEVVEESKIEEYDGLYCYQISVTDIDEQKSYDYFSIMFKIGEDSQKAALTIAMSNIVALYLSDSLGTDLKTLRTTPQ